MSEDVTVDSLDLPQEIYRIFLVNDVVWNLEGQLRRPTRADISDALDRMKERLYDEPTDATIAVGQLLMMKIDGHYDVYVRIGEV